MHPRPNSHLFSIAFEYLVNGDDSLSFLLRFDVVWQCFSYLDAIDVTQVIPLLSRSWCISSCYSQFWWQISLCRWSNVKDAYQDYVKYAAGMLDKESIDCWRCFYMHMSRRDRILTNFEHSIPSPMYMSAHQLNINPRRRQILVDWLVEVTEVFKCQRRIIFLTTYLLDYYSSLGGVIPLNKYQLVGSVCLLLAMVHLDAAIPKISDIDNQNGAETLEELEIEPDEEIGVFDDAYEEDSIENNFFFDHPWNPEFEASTHTPVAPPHVIAADAIAVPMNEIETVVITSAPSSAMVALNTDSMAVSQTSPPFGKLDSQEARIAYLTDGAFTEEDIHHYKSKIVIALINDNQYFKFLLPQVNNHNTLIKHCPSPCNDFFLVCDWLNKFLHAAGKREDSGSVTFFMTHYIAELALVEYESLVFPAAMLAASCFALSCYNLQINKAWVPLLYKHCTYSLEELQPCLQMLVKLVHKTVALDQDPTSDLHAVFHKYCQQRFLSVASIILDDLKSDTPTLTYFLT
jgi:hypothetical protein